MRLYEWYSFDQTSSISTNKFIFLEFFPYSLSSVSISKLFQIISNLIIDNEFVEDNLILDGKESILQQITLLSSKNPG